MHCLYVVELYNTRGETIIILLVNICLLNENEGRLLLLNGV